MDKGSIIFVLFGMAVALVSNLNRSPAWRSMVLLAGSIVFLGLSAPNVGRLAPLIGFVVLGYLGLFLIERRRSRYEYWVLIIIFAYIWLKQYSFFPEGVFLHFPYSTLGLSYIFFRVLHLLIEAGSGSQSERIHVKPIPYALYALNFTTLVSGPIQPYDEFAQDQLASEPPPLTLGIISLQLERIIRGLFKVNVLAALLDASQRDALIQVSQPWPPVFKLFAAFRLCVVYPFFLYANFSGYIDIVIAIARLMRLQLPENFDRPFASSSFIEFWSHWHITLSTWLKTYVYNPLLVVLARRVSSPFLEPYLAVVCYFATFFLVGIWHGRTSEFVVFGILQGGGVALNKLWQLALIRRLGRREYKTLCQSIGYVAFCRGLTFSWFAFTLFWFWGDWKQIQRVFYSLPAIEWACLWIVIWSIATIVLSAWEGLRGAVLAIRTPVGPVLNSRYARVVYAAALGFISILVSVWLSQPSPDIVYKAF